MRRLYQYTPSICFNGEGRKNLNGCISIHLPNMELPTFSLSPTGDAWKDIIGNSSAVFLITFLSKFVCNKYFFIDRGQDVNRRWVTWCLFIVPESDEMEFFVDKFVTVLTYFDVLSCFWNQTKNYTPKKIRIYSRKTGLHITMIMCMKWKRFKRHVSSV